MPQTYFNNLIFGYFNIIIGNIITTIYNYTISTYNEYNILGLVKSDYMQHLFFAVLFTQYCGCGFCLLLYVYFNIVIAFIVSTYKGFFKNM